MADSGGEEDNDDVEDLLNDAFLGSDDEGGYNTDEGANRSGRHDDPDVEKLFDDMEKSLFLGCEDFSVLNFLLRMMHVKVTCKISNIAMDMMLQLLNEAFKMEILPKNHYEAKQYLRSLGLGYESIHVCKNDYALFWKENADMQLCPICKSSCWIEKRTSDWKKVPKKVLRYFPITSRLKRLYNSRHTA